MNQQNNPELEIAIRDNKELKELSTIEDIKTKQITKFHDEKEKLELEILKLEVSIKETVISRDKTWRTQKQIYNRLEKKHKLK